MQEVNFNSSVVFKFQFILRFEKEHNMHNQMIYFNDRLH